MKEYLLLGCGSQRDKLFGEPNSPDFSDGKLTTLDINADHKPDVVWDMTERPYPFEDSSFDELHAYEVLEHLGAQGDYESFFAEFSEFWRILKPGGVLFATVPWWQSAWAWGDPSHKRVIQPETLTYLVQEQYEKQVGITPMSDFRYIYKADFKVVYAERVEDSFYFAIQAVKPALTTEV